MLLVSEFKTDLSLIVVLSCGTISLLIFVNFLIIWLFPHLLSTHLYLICQPLFFSKSSKLIFFTFLFLRSVYSPGLPLDRYLWYWPSFVVSSHIHVVPFIFISFMPIVFDFWMSKNKLSLVCSTFIGTINHLHFILLFAFTSSHTISQFSFSFFPRSRNVKCYLQGPRLRVNFKALAFRFLDR